MLVVTDAVAEYRLGCTLELAATSDAPRTARLGASHSINAFQAGEAPGWKVVVSAVSTLMSSPATTDFSALTTPANASLANGYKNLALHRDALILAVRPFQDVPANAGVDSFTASDPDNGLAIRVQRGRPLDAPWPARGPLVRGEARRGPRKVAPGPLFGISRDVWSALAIAVTYAIGRGNLGPA